MNRRKQNGANRLDDAVATFINTQASFQSNMLAMQAEIRQIDVERREIERRNEAKFEKIVAILKRHEQMLRALPEAIREKIGFRRERK
jgi:hypothetical protein